MDSTKSCNVVGCRTDVQLVSHIDTKLADKLWISLSNFEQRLCHDLSLFIVFVVVLAFLKQASRCDIKEIHLRIFNMDAKILKTLKVLLHLLLKFHYFIFLKGEFNRFVIFLK